MRDIGTRIRRYRLSRYAAPADSLRRRLKWIWPVAALWLAYVALLSDHSLYRIWRMSVDNARTQSELEVLRREIDQLDRELRDPAAKRALAERTLRERDGWAQPGEIIYRIEGSPPDTLR